MSTAGDRYVSRSKTLLHRMQSSVIFVPLPRMDLFDESVYPATNFKDIFSTHPVLNRALK